MKSFLLGIISIIAVASFSSCNKDFTCRCSFVDSTKNFDVKIKKVRKNDAKVICDEYSTFVGNCAIK